MTKPRFPEQNFCFAAFTLLFQFARVNSRISCFESVKSLNHIANCSLGVMGIKPEEGVFSSVKWHGLARDTLEHQNRGSAVPYACAQPYHQGAQPYHQGNGSQLFRHQLLGLISMVYLFCLYRLRGLMDKVSDFG